MNQTNAKVDLDDKGVKINELILKKSSLTQSKEISSYIFLSGLITKSVLDDMVFFS